jgi:hypothetical protein
VATVFDELRGDDYTKRGFNARGGQLEGRAPHTIKRCFIARGSQIPLSRDVAIDIVSLFKLIAHEFCHQQMFFFNVTCSHTLTECSITFFLNSRDYTITGPPLQKGLGCNRGLSISA